MSKPRSASSETRRGGFGGTTAAGEGTDELMGSGAKSSTAQAGIAVNAGLAAAGAVQR